MFSLKEKHTIIKNTRNKEGMKKIKEVVKVLNGEDGEGLEEKIDGIQRLGMYTESRRKPVRIKFKFQRAATEVFHRTEKFKKIDKFKTVWIK